MPLPCPCRCPLKQGIYAPNNFTAGRRTDVGDYLKETSAQISALLDGSGVAANAATSAALNASLAALPIPLLDPLQAAEVQLAAMQAYAAATTWLAANANGTGAA